MGVNEAQETSINFMTIAIVTVIACFIVNFIYKTVFGNDRKEAGRARVESEGDSSAQAESNADVQSVSRPLGKNKKRPQQKGKSEFNHPWLLKSLKGHPGTILHADISANGKFLAATCDDPVSTENAATAATRRRKQRDRRRCPPSTPPPPTPSPPPPPPPPEDRGRELKMALRPHILTQERMWALGYPIEIEPTKAVVYIHPRPRTRTLPFTALDVNAPEFVPGSQTDSGRGSCASSPRSESDEESETVAHTCVRCEKKFLLSKEGEYLNAESCVYHWGRLIRNSGYECCKSVYGTKGCSTARVHVWTGTKPGMNGPLNGYVRASKVRGGIYSIDAEMCYTAAGLELTSIAVIATDGKLVYSSLVKPSLPIVDCNTRFSGIRMRDLVRVTKTLREVQNDILEFVGTDTILIGHALDSDLRALKLIHGAVVDTCDLYPHTRGFPFRRSLRALTEEQLGRYIQRGSSGHSPLEDARAAMDLVLKKIDLENKDNNMTRPPFMLSIQPYDPLICAT